MIPYVKNIALVAHDSCKKDLVDWIKKNRDLLLPHSLYATGTTGTLIARECNLTVTRFFSGPLGGDQQIGAKIAENEINTLIFFWDPLTAQPHDPDVKALLRISVLYDILMACNAATADFVIRSSEFQKDYVNQPLKVLEHFRKDKP